jgi:NAD(P)-dependent dehydrogenase (short-subunit alcohol dehydrogenase family)
MVIHEPVGRVPKARPKEAFPVPVASLAPHLFHRGLGGAGSEGERMHVVISGANRGIGLELCRQARQRGWKVTALCRASSPALKETGADVVEGVDVARPPKLPDLPGIDWLLLNAGIWRTENLSDMNFDTMLEQLEVNSLGPLRIFDALSDKLRSGSKVGLMTSQMGSIADNSSGGRYGYRMSKAALNIAGVSLAHDLRSRGVAVALLHPGYVATDMTNHRGITTPEDSVRGLLKVMDGLSLESSGGFWNFRGERLPW